MKQANLCVMVFLVGFAIIIQHTEIMDKFELEHNHCCCYIATLEQAEAGIDRVRIESDLGTKLSKFEYGNPVSMHSPERLSKTREKRYIPVFVMCCFTESECLRQLPAFI
jgi:hypothetical protein